MKYENYIFDLYGTLADIHTDEDSSYVWEKMTLIYGYFQAWYNPAGMRDAFRRIREEEEQRREEIQIENVFARLFKEKGAEPKDEQVSWICRFFRAVSTEYIRLYPRVQESLKELREQGKHIYLLTNAQRAFTEYELRMLKIEDCFDGIYISSDYGVKKPNKLFFEKMIAKSGIDPRQSVMVGNDMICDIEGAKNAGLDAIYIHTNLSPEYPFCLPG